MASSRVEVIINSSSYCIWDALRDVSNVHKRVVPSFVTDCRMEGEARVVAFGNGTVAKELIVDVDDKAIRLVWSARSERLARAATATGVC